VKRQRDEAEDDEEEMRRLYPGRKYAEMDDEAIWASICRMAAKDAGVTVERARAILEEAGQTADSHNGMMEAIDTVLWVARRKWLPPG
jgi:hypothetical protein